MQFFQYTSLLGYILPVRPPHNLFSPIIFICKTFIFSQIYKKNLFSLERKLFKNLFGRQHPIED